MATENDLEIACTTFPIALLCLQVLALSIQSPFPFFHEHNSSSPCELVFVFVCSLTASRYRLVE